MKGLFFLFALVGNFVSLCAAYGQAGAAERYVQAFFTGVIL